MNLDYYSLPFGAQLLLWTSRIAINASCRNFPNKYQLVDKAYKKVGLIEGLFLLKDLLAHLRKNKDFKLQSICSRNLILNEINLINCVEENKYSNFGIHEDKDWPEYFNYSTKPLRYLFNLNEFDFSEISPDVYETFKELADLNIEWDKRDKIRERKAEKNLVQLENFLLLKK